MVPSWIDIFLEHEYIILGSPFRKSDVGYGRYYGRGDDRDRSSDNLMRLEAALEAARRGHNDK